MNLNFAKNVDINRNMRLALTGLRNKRKPKSQKRKTIGEKNEKEETAMFIRGSAEAAAEGKNLT